MGRLDKVVKSPGPRRVDTVPFLQRRDGTSSGRLVLPSTHGGFDSGRT